jgi:3-isopropylmalate/(R)-2-methylmalate dehydratase small subunit
MDFALNQPRFKGASILLTRENFGCGSSREHAPWALDDYGFRVVIASSFADIFYNNCFKNGLLPIVLSKDIVESLFLALDATEGYQLLVDLEQQSITLPDDTKLSFEIDPFYKQCLLEGLDEIGLTLQDAQSISSFEQQWRKDSPWLFDAF